ncbi:MAG: hypothetical protein WAO76_09150 [Georgfuchsia sp.]
MRIGHFSDIHYANETLGEVDKCFSAAVDSAIASGIEIAVISGDATDHRLDVHAPAFIALAKQVRRLSDHCPVLMLQGTYSHEPPGTLDIFRLIGGRYEVFVADRICQVALLGDQWMASDDWCFNVGTNFQSSDWRALFTCLPTTNKAAVATVVGTIGVADAVGDNIARLLSGYGVINRQARLSGIPTIGVSHGTVSGCETEHGVPMVGLDHEFTTGSLFAAECDAFMLGHIHKHQSWERDGRIIAYAGSIGRLHYGEEDAKGYLEWELASDEVTCRQIEMPARRMVHLEFSGLPDMARLEEAKAAAAGAFVRIRWTVDEEYRNAVDRDAIEAVFAGSAEVKLEPRILPIVRSRAEGMNRVQSYGQKLDKWCQATETSSNGLHDLLAAIQGNTPEAIAASLLN